MDGKKKLTFADLPLKLREMIWERAIWNREGLSAAHFFNVSENGLESHIDASEDPFNTTWTPDRCAYRSPCWDPSEPQKLRWSSDDNISGYTQDSGLWNACRESRSVLIRCWRKRPKSYLGRRLKGVIQVNNQKVPDDDGDFYIVTHPKQDLLCMNIAYLRDTLGCMGKSLSFYHTGFIFNPSWVHEIEQRSKSSHHTNYHGPYLEIYFREREKPTVVDRFLHHLEEYWEAHGCVWLIDYRLKPTAKLHYDKIAEGGKGRHVFRARDRRFVEVMEEDIKPGRVPLLAGTDDYRWTSDSDDSSGNERDPVPNSFPFITRHIENYFMAATDLGSFGGSCSPQEMWSPAVGVLGCVMEEDI